MRSSKQLLSRAVFLVAAIAPSQAPGAPCVEDWPGTQARASAVLVASAKLSGLWAVAIRTSGPVRIHDIRGKLVHELAVEDLAEILPDVDLTRPGAGLGGLCFTDSGRQLFMAVRGSPGQSAIVALNLNTKQLRVFARADLADGPGRCGMAHFGGRLYVGARAGLLRYEATRNVKSADGAVTIRIPGRAGVRGVAVDSVAKRLYAITGGELYGIDLAASDAAPQRLATGEDFRSLTFGRTYGGADDGGLYALRGTGEIVCVPTANLRAGGPVDFKPYYRSPREVTDIAATACGRILLGGAAPKVLSDSADTRMDFEEWVRDKFKQYILMAKSVLWPDGEPEGWVKIAAATAGNTRLPPAGSVSAAMTVLMLLVGDSVQKDPDARGQVRSILKRYAGTHADGISPQRNIDGQFVDFADPTTGRGTWGAFANPYSSMLATPLHAAGNQGAELFTNFTTISMW